MGSGHPAASRVACGGAARKLAALQDAQLEALFAAVAEGQRQGGDCRLDLLVAYTASAAEFAAKRELSKTWPIRHSATLMRRHAASGR